MLAFFIHSLICVKKEDICVCGIFLNFHCCIGSVCKCFPCSRKRCVWPRFFLLFIFFQWNIDALYFTCIVISLPQTRSKITLWLEYYICWPRIYVSLSFRCVFLSHSPVLAPLLSAHISFVTMSFLGFLNHYIPIGYHMKKKLKKIK